MSTPTIDYDALAQQHGGSAAVDYDALAAQHGGSTELPQGVKVVGHNSAGQPIYGPEGTAPEQTLGHFLSSAGNVIGDAAKSLVPHSLGDLAKRALPGYAQYQMVVKPSVEQAKQAFEAAKAGSPALAAGHGLAALVPVAGPQAAQVGEQIGSKLGTGDYTGAAGTAAGNAALVAGGAMAPKALGAVAPAAGRVALLGKTAEGAYESALKPSTVLTPAERTAAVQTALKNEIPISQAGVEKLNQLIDNLEHAKTAEINADPNRPIDPNKVATRAEQAKARFANQVNAGGDLSAIDAAKRQFLAEQGAPLDSNGNPTGPAPYMSASSAQAMKQGTYQVLKGKYGEQGSASVEAQKALARGLKEELNSAFPELKNLNADQGRLLDLQPLLEHAVNRIGNHQAIGIGTPIAGTAVKAATGSSLLGGAGMVMKAVLDNPAIKSRLSIAVSKGGKIPYSQAISRVNGFSDALGVAAASAPASQGQSPTQ